MRWTVPLILLAACTRPSADTPITKTTDPVDAAPQPKQPKPKPKPERSYCEQDSECAFDDPCVATACVGKGDAAFVGCDESAPPPGRCICAGSHCTLMRKDAASGAAKTGCKSDGECAFEPATGSCVAGSDHAWIERRGGFCACSAGTCTPQFVDDVPCKTSSDCSWLESPKRPAPASKVPRPHPPVIPCSTGSFDSVCHAGRCELRVWKC